MPEPLAWPEERNNFVIPANQIRQGRSQCLGAVQRFGSPQAHAFFFCELFEGYVDIVEHFDVIAQKSDGMQEDAAMAFGF